VGLLVGACDSSELPLQVSARSASRKSRRFSWTLSISTSELCVCAACCRVCVVCTCACAQLGDEEKASLKRRLAELQLAQRKHLVYEQLKQAALMGESRHELGHAFQTALDDGRSLAEVGR
jgi:hypothetical protein